VYRKRRAKGGKGRDRGEGIDDAAHSCRLYYHQSSVRVACKEKTFEIERCCFLYCEYLVTAPEDADTTQAPPPPFCGFNAQSTESMSDEKGRE